MEVHPGDRRSRARSGLVVALFALVGTVLAVAAPATVYAEAGDLDPSFSRDGRVLTDIGGDDKATAIAIQPDGNIVVAGFSSPPGGTRRFALVRYEPNGDRDPAFGSDGIVTTRFGDESAAQALAIQPDGRIVVAGIASHPERGWDFALARYNPNGSLDTTFSGDGRLTTDFDGGTDAAHALALQPDGRIVLGGESEGDFAAARYEPGGQLDSSFGGDGLVRTDFAGGSDVAYALALQPDGKLVLAGSATQSSGYFDWVPAVARYEADGDLDPSLLGRRSGHRGLSRERLARNTRRAWSRGAAERPNRAGRSGPFGLRAGRLPGPGLRRRRVGAGRCGLCARARRAATRWVARRRWDERLDPRRLRGRSMESERPPRFDFRRRPPAHSSSSAGGALTGFGIYSADEARAAAIQQDGKIVVAGMSFPGYDGPGYTADPADFAVARYRVDRLPPDDADADGVADSLDLCPRLYNSEESDGCPHYPRSVTIRYSNRADAFKGRVLTPEPRCIGRHGGHLQAKAGRRCEDRL